ncbi:hypothetical protein H4219_004901 [Mycoemilia scoparia]|uniref:Uncharacterized protein n=1 Tax=Mycoemilia scoparia TaxID=417184 RepID=A0A9W7ZZN0_9FUNG|nr:hypothetical protein H4219_004901 [Mycoemilia scoparia]
MAATNPPPSPTDNMWTTSTLIIPEGPSDDKSVVYTLTNSPDHFVTVISYTFHDTLLGNVTYFYQTLAMISLILSFLLMVIVIAMFFIRKEIATRPSVRLSGWMGLTDFILSLILFIRFDYDFMSTRSQASLKVLNWLMSAMPLTFVLLNTCIVFQLQLTVLMRKERLAQILSRGYEVFSFTLGLGLPLVIFKFAPTIVWDGQQLFFFPVPDTGSHIKDVLLRSYLWEFIAMAYCIVVTVLLVFRLFPMWSRFRNNTSSNNNNSSSNNNLVLPEGTTTTSTSSSTSTTAMMTAKTTTTETYGDDINNNDNYYIKSNPRAEKRYGGFGGPGYFYSNYNNNNGSATTLCSNNSSNYQNPGGLYHNLNNNVSNAPINTHFNPSPNYTGPGVGFYSPLIKKQQQHLDLNNRNPTLTTTTTTTPTTTYGTTKQRNQIRKTILRIMLYPIVLILFRLPYDLFITADVPYYFYHGIYVLCGVQGIFNFVVFLVNPGLDEFWTLLRERFGNRSF